MVTPREKVSEYEGIIEANKKEKLDLQDQVVAANNLYCSRLGRSQT